MATRVTSPSDQKRTAVTLPGGDVTGAGDQPQLIGGKQHRRQHDFTAPS